MKLAIVGQGAAGLFLALNIASKDSKHKIDITLIDKNINPGRKLYVTGNGRCNLANKVVDRYSYNDQLATRLTSETDYIKMVAFLRNLGMGTRVIDNLVYPYSLNAPAFVDNLINLLKSYKVKFINKTEVLEYSLLNDAISIKTNSKSLLFDKVVFTTGGKSHKVFGSDGSFFEVLKKHKYKIEPLKVGLAPIKVLENVKPIENERLKCISTLLIDGHQSYKENGEVLFKKDGLSGICIFNISSMIARDPGFKEAKIYLDLFPDLPNSTLLSQFEKDNQVSKYNFLEGYFTKNMAEYIRKFSKCKNLMQFDETELKKIVNFVKNMEFTYQSTYSFDDSQVTIGGINLKEINENFESTREKNIYFIGEILDLDGLCGGYNLMLCFAEAKKLSDYLISIK